MLLAGKLIERELQDAPGCERYANVIAGPREFWTLTIWRDASEMRSWMRDGRHGRVMWQQPYWLRCYWGMRWRPGRYQSGKWEGNSWQWPEAEAPEPSPEAQELPSAAMPPWMQAALGKSVRLEERQVAGAAGVTYRLRVPPWSLPSALSELRRLGRAASSDTDSCRYSIGLGTGGALYLLVIARTEAALKRLRASAEHRRFMQRWGARAWWSTWEPQSEFGNWESYKLRDRQLADEPLLLDVELPAHPSSARHARQRLRSRLQDVDPETLDAVRLLSSKLVANSARHAGLEPSDEIRLEIRAKRDWIRVEVIDRGKPFEPHVPLCKSLEDGSGWGLYVVNQMADRWGIISRPPERRVWFELRTESPIAARQTPLERPQALL